MGDSLKISKDKRHRSSSSLAGVVLDSTRSERKLDVNVSIPEVEDQFAIAEARCDDLQDKIDLIKSLKRKKKLKKRSMTKVTEQASVPETMPMITVRTQPKKKVSQQAARLHRIEVPSNPTRGYLDPATIEQHRMIGQVRGYNNAFSNPHQDTPASKAPFTVRLPPNAEAGRRPKSRSMRQRSQADGDRSNYVDNMSMSQGRPYDHEVAPDGACGHDERYSEYSHGSNYEEDSKPEPRRQTKQGRRRHVPRDVPVKAFSIVEERPVVELFNKNFASSEVPRQEIQQPSSAPKKSRKARVGSKPGDEILSRLETIVNDEQEPQLKKPVRYPRRVKYHNRRYELPTVASQMKQAGMRYYYDSSNHNNIPFVVSKSTAPSHNIGVNIQQVLNGLKIQQPLTGIPLTIAHHMGLGHVPTYSTKSASMVPAHDHREINAIKVGRRLLRLPSYKYVSYNRLLNLYREGDGMVPRFLRAISRPHYFYTSMYNLTTNNDFDGATSKGCAAGSQEAKQNLAEFACLYREYEKINKNLKEGKYDFELEQRREELSKELALREQHIRKVVADYQMSTDVDQTLRASASTAEEGYRHSAIKFGGDAPN